MKKDYKVLLSEKQFLQVQRRAFQLTGAHLRTIMYKDNEVVFETVSGTDHKTIWTQRIIIDDLASVDLKKLNYNKLADIIKKSRLRVHCNCLVPGTLITTNYGKKYIETISKNDYVLSSDGKFYKVVALLQGNRRELIKITLTDGTTITCSPEHKIRTIVFRRSSLKPAGELQVGEQLLGLKEEKYEGTPRSSDYKIAQISSIDHLYGKTKVYDISLMEGPHDFHANGYIVSNCPAFLYWGFAYKAYKKGYGIVPEKRRPIVRNPEMRGYICKHIFNALQTYPSWAKEFAAKWKKWDKTNTKSRNKRKKSDSAESLEDAMDEEQN